MDFDWQAAMSHPLTLMGAGMMAGADPRRTGFGGIGAGILEAQSRMAQQAQFEDERERAQRLADLQARTMEAEMAGLQAQQEERQRQLQAQEGLLAQPGLTPLQRAGIQAGYGQQIMGQMFKPEAAQKPYTKAAQIASDVRAEYLSPEMGEKLIKQELEGGEVSPADRFKMESDLNKRFDKNAQAFKEISNAYTTIQTIPETAIGDVALATKIMKLLDPGSVVRESELGVALGATGILDRLLNLANRAKEGEFLTADQRREFKALAENVYTAAQQEFSNLRTNYANIASGYGLNPENVVYDYSSRVAGGGQRVTPPQGFVMDK